MTNDRKAFEGWTECLLDARRTPLEHLDAANAWCAWALAKLGVDERGLPCGSDVFRTRTRLETGLAITPLGAARCVREHRRTAVFLQAMAAAIRTARARFPGERIHVLEAGCGPLAALSLPFALRYPAEEVSFTLLDVHEASLVAARRLAEVLGVAESIRTCIAADAATVRFTEAERPHVIGCEVLLRALTKEPQVAVTLNLAPQLRAGGCFLPERIEVHAVLMDAGRHCRIITGLAARDEGPSIEELGKVFCLEAAAVEKLERRAGGGLVAGSVRVPPHEGARVDLRLLTRIQVLGEHGLGDFESSLNLPELLDYPAELATEGGMAEFYYEVSANPGLRLVAHGAECVGGSGSAR